MRVTHLLALIVPVAIFTGCFSMSDYRTLQNDSYTIDKNESIAVFYKNDAESARFAREINKSLKKNGFNVKDSKNSVCELFFDFGSPAYKSIQNRNLQYLSLADNGDDTSLNSGNLIIPMSQTNSNLSYYKRVHASIYCTANGKKEMVWDGIAHMDLGPNYLYQEKAVDNLVALIGKNFDGSLRVGNYSKSGESDVTKAIKFRDRRNFAFINANIGYAGIALAKFDEFKVDNKSYERAVDMFFPVSLRLGYMHTSKRTGKYGFGVNAVYSKGLYTNSYDIETASYDNPKVTASQLGLELMGLINHGNNPNGINSVSTYFALGVTKNIDSKLTVSSKNSSNSDITRDFDSFYIPIRVGWMFHIPASRAYATMEMSSSIPLGASYMMDVFTAHFGLMLLL